MSLDKKLLGIATSAVEKQRKTRDSRNPVSKSLDIATNKSYVNEDKKTAAAALRQWENNTWKPKVEAKLKQEIKTRAPHLKPGTKAYQQTYDNLFNKNYKDLQTAKAKAQQQIGTLRKPQQTQRQLDNEYRQNEAVRNKATGAQAAAHAIRDTGEAVSGALATGTSRTLRYPLQFAADIGENDDGGIFDRGAKALERHEDNLQKVYPAYTDIQQNGNFGQKLAISAVEQMPTLAASFGTAGAAAKGALALGAGAKTTAAISYGTAAATMYPQAYGDGSDSTKQELENATPEQLATAVRSKDIYKGHFDKNIKAGMSESEAHQKSRDQTISSIAEESGDAVGLATLALSMLAPGVGSFTANRAAGGAVSKWGQKVFNTLAVKADAGKVAKHAVPAAVGAGIVGLNVAEEALQEGFTDYTAQKAAVDVGVKDKIDTAQTKEAMLMGGILGGAMGGGVYVGTCNSKLHQAQDDLKTAQQAYAEVAGQIPQLQQQIEDVSPRSPEGQALTAQLEETRSVLDAMAAEAEKASIPRTSLARRAPRIDPTNSTANDFDGQVDGATELSEQDFENALNPDGTPAQEAAPVVQPMSEAELDAQDAQIAELIAEQEALDAAIEDGSNEKPLEESIAAAQSWYDSKRGEGKQGLAGVVSRAAATEQDTAFAQQQEAIKGATTSIDDYIASERAKQQQIDGQLQQESEAATTDAEKQAVAQKIEQREAARAKEDELLLTREQLAQPYENESFDTTIVGADGAPFNLARFWDSNMPAGAKAKAIADAFGGQVDQNVAKADWQSMPEGVQKELHQWMTGRLDAVRQSREGGEQVAEQPIQQQQAEEPTVNGLTMPVQQPAVEQAPIAPVEAEQVAEVGSTPAATQLTNENTAINIPAPITDEPALIESQAPVVDEVTTEQSPIAVERYKSKPAARAAIKKQEIDPQSVSIVSMEDGYAIVEAGTNQAEQTDESNVSIQEQQSEPVNTESVATAAIELTEQNPVINIPAPVVSEAATESENTTTKIYKSKSAAQAAIKKQKLNLDSVSINQVKGGGFEIVKKASPKPTYAQAQEQAATELGMTLDENGEYGGTDAELETFFNRIDEIRGRTLSSKEQTSQAPKVSSENGSLEAEDLSATNPEVTSTPKPTVETGEQSAPAKRAAAKKATKNKAQSKDVTTDSASESKSTAVGVEADKQSSPKKPKEIAAQQFTAETQSNVEESETVAASPVKPPQPSVAKAETAPETKKPVAKTEKKPEPNPVEKPTPTGDWRSQVGGNEIRDNKDGITVRKHDRVVHIRGATSIAANKKAKELVSHEIRDLHYIAAKENSKDPFSEASIWLDGQGDMIRKKGTKKPKGALLQVLKQSEGSPKAQPTVKPDNSNDNAGMSSSTEPKFSKANPAKGNTGTTAKQVVRTLQKRFGKEAVAALIKSGKLRVRTLNDFVNADGRLLIPDDAEGFYHREKVVLIADNLTTDTAVATLLHELGGHAGIQSMLETQTYMSLMENFYDLVRSGNKYAVRAKERAEASAYSDSEARDEYIPYLITEYSQATERGGPLAVIKRFVNRVMAGVRAWVRNHTGVQLKMTPNDMVQLAERMVKRLAEQSMDSVTIAGVENMPAAQMQFSQESVQQANTPAFRKWLDTNNPDTRYSRRYSSLGTDGKPVTAKERARDRVALAQATTMSSKFGVNLLLRRHLATPQHVALLNPVFKIFTDNVQARIAYENNEVGLVQTYLPEIWDTRLVVGKKKEAMERVSKAIFDGTMADKVWSDNELQTMFGLTDKDINFYRRARQAVDGSVLNMTVDTLSALAKGTKLVSLPTVQRLKLAGLTPIGHNLMLQKHMTDELEKLAKGGLITPKAEARMQKQLDAVFDVMSAVAGKYDKLVEDGYAPLMRFGHYAVEVRDKVSNDLDLFELYETKGQQRKAIKELKERYDESQFTIGTGTLNPEGFKQFKDKGLSPETVQLFAAELGLDDDGAYQAYLKIAVSDRSALKRLIHRKKVPGYSEDMPRVLSSFVMSNARYSGRSLYNNEIERSIQNIEDGNLQNEAQKVFENMENPQEEFAQQRSLMFHYFMGFSPAFLFLNLTQPFTQTIPKLTAYVGAGKGHAYMAQALGMVGKNMGASAINMGKKAAGLPTPNWKGFEDSLPAWVKKEDYLRMAREGHLDPQNIYMIKGLERGKGGVASGVWGNIEAAAGWPAEVSESINRRSTMIAAFRVAKDMGAAKLKAKGFDSDYDFAVSIIQQTQGIYNKANRSGLARGNGKLGQYGPLILVFKQFTINYTEQMIRHGRDKEIGALAVAMMWQFGLAGMLGLPFADDLRDIFEGIAYRVFGKAFNLPDYLEGLLGKSNADALMYGLASEKGRIDIFGRSSLGNVIPGTDVIRPGPTDWAEILGASSGFYESFFSAASMAADGKYKDALITASPRYIRDAASGAEIAMTGSYRNTKGDKIMDLDKTDALIKSMAFNPANNARPGRDRSNAYQMKNMLKAKTDYFSKHLAEAIYQENDERVDELYNEMDEWNDRNAEHFNIDIDKIEKSAEKRVERKDFGSAERQNVQDSLAERQEDLAGT